MFEGFAGGRQVVGIAMSDFFDQQVAYLPPETPVI
jgi:hypothetical protein